MQVVSSTQPLSSTARLNAGQGDTENQILADINKEIDARIGDVRKSIAERIIDECRNQISEIEKKIGWLRTVTGSSARSQPTNAILTAVENSIRSFCGSVPNKRFDRRAIIDNALRRVPVATAQTCSSVLARLVQQGAVKAEGASIARRYWIEV